jgi:hypothetical protein
MRMTIADLAIMAPTIDNPVEDWSLDGLRCELERYWNLANDSFFGGVLRPVVFTFSPTRKALGHYLSDGWHLNGSSRDEVNLDPQYFDSTITEKIKTLVHEAAHQWQFITGKPGKANYHNKPYRVKLEQIGIPCNEKGLTTDITTDFKAWVTSHNPTTALEPQRIKTGGRSTAPTKMKKWSCDCTNVRCAVDLDSTCHKCGALFKPAGWLNQV